MSRVLIPGDDVEMARQPVMDVVDAAPPDLTLRPSEQALVAQVAPQLQQDPEDYIAIPVQLAVNAKQPGAVMPMRLPNGQVADMVVLHFVLTLPFDNLKTSKVLLANGQMPDPLMGMVPLMEARMVLPRARLRPEMLALLEGKTPASADPA